MVLGPNGSRYYVLLKSTKCCCGAWKYMFVLYNPCSNHFTRCVSNVLLAKNYLQLFLCMPFYAYQMMLSVCCVFRLENNCFDNRVVWWICCDPDKSHLDQLDQVCPRNPIGFLLDSWSKIQNPVCFTVNCHKAPRATRARARRAEGSMGRSNSFHGAL